MPDPVVPFPGPRCLVRFYKTSLFFGFGLLLGFLELFKQEGIQTTRKVHAAKVSAVTCQTYDNIPTNQNDSIVTNPWLSRAARNKTGFAREEADNNANDPRKTCSNCTFDGITESAIPLLFRSNG